MKKFILSIVVISTITFTACSSDDDSNEESEDNCVTCAAFDLGGETFPEVEICEGDNGNAFFNGQDTTVAFDFYISTLEQSTTCD